MGKFPTEEELVDAVHAHAADSANVIFSDHALEQMAERDISDADVLRILQKGDIRGQVRPAKEKNGWRFKVVYLLRGIREAGVVTVVHRDDTELPVVTVEWEDLS